MPWHIGTSEECPPSKPFAVIKDADDSVAGCHETRESAEAQMAALYASETKMQPIKAEQVGNAKWRVLAIPFWGPFKGGKDGDGEYFSPHTDIKAGWFRERPVLWHHGLDADLKADDDDISTDAIGIEGELEKKRDGWWADMWLERSHAYWEQISRMLAAGKVYGSSGALGHAVRKAADGEILVWPHIEQTLTPTPANPFARVVPVKAWQDFTDAGITVDADMAPLFTEPVVPDLGPDLAPSGVGDDPAMARLADQLTQLEALVQRLR